MFKKLWNFITGNRTATQSILALNPSISFDSKTNLYTLTLGGVRFSLTQAQLNILWAKLGTMTKSDQKTTKTV
jgi:hypothetical protein